MAVMVRPDPGTSYEPDGWVNVEFFHNVTLRIRYANPHDLQCVMEPPLRWYSDKYSAKTRLDINLNDLKNDPKFDYAKITIILDDDNIFFMPPFNGKNYAITVSTIEAKEDITNLIMGPPGLNHETLSQELSFLCKIVHQDDESTHGFNIGLVVREAGDSDYELPIIIDPKVRNDGG